MQTTTARASILGMGAFAVLLLGASAARAQGEAPDSEMPPPIEEEAPQVVQAAKPTGKPDRNRWEVFGGFQGYLAQNPGARALFLEGAYSRVLWRHLDAGVGLGLDFGSCCTAGGSYFGVPFVAFVRFYPLVKNAVTGVFDATTGEKVRVMTRTPGGRSFAPYFLLDTGGELSFESTQLGGASAFGWIVGGGFGVDYNVSNASSFFGQLHVQLNPTGVRYSGVSSAAGKLNAVLVAVGYRL